MGDQVSRFRLAREQRQRQERADEPHARVPVQVDPTADVWFADRRR